MLMYRANFFSNLISTLGWGLFQVLSIFLFTNKVQSVYGWSKNELIILVIVYSIFIGIFHTFFSRNFQRFSQLIDSGQLDMLLLKPLDSQFLVSFWVVNYANLVRVILAFILLLYIMIAWMKMPLTVLDVIGFLVITFLGNCLLYTIWFTVCTLMIWFPRMHNLVDLMYDVSSIARFPQETVKHAAISLFLFVFPLTLIVTTPTKVLVHKAFTGDVFGMIICGIVLVFVSRLFWKFSLRYYTSASG